MRKIDFTEFEVGTIFNKASIKGEVKLARKKLLVSYPSRLEAMALDPAKIVDNNNLIYEAGQIDFCIALFKHILVEVDESSSDVTISERTPRRALVMHAVLLMKEALGFSHGLKIDVEDTFYLRHCGLGSSSSLIAGTAAAINELYACPIEPLDLVRYCAQNHGEEIDGDDSKLVPVQCIGGSGVCGHFEGGLVILAGQATPIYTKKLSDDLKVVIGIPYDFEHPDSQELMRAELDNISAFKDTGKQYGKEIAYRLIHQVLPGLGEDSLKSCKDLIFDYRWDMGSIRNCSFVYPRMIEIAEKMRGMKDDNDIAIVSLSSVGPGFFALTSNPTKVEKQFNEIGLKTHLSTIYNDKYLVKEIPYGRSLSK